MNIFNDLAQASYKAFVRDKLQQIEDDKNDPTLISRAGGITIRRGRDLTPEEKATGHAYIKFVNNETEKAETLS